MRLYHIRPPDEQYAQLRRRSQERSGDHLRGSMITPLGVEG
jgi:hypothetical protein